MYRIAEEQENELRHLLDRFRSNHPAMRVEPRMLDLSSCFYGKNGRVSVPNYWYDGEAEPVVKAYVVRDGPILKKFDVNKWSVNKDGRKDYARTHYKITEDFKVLTMLCANQTRNTTVSEFLDFGWESWNPAGISTLDKRILKIEHSARMQCRGDFNPLTDNAFIFCREKTEDAENAIRLNAIWMGLIGKYGGKFLDFPPFPYEAEIARKVFPADFFSDPAEKIIKRESYQYGIKAHTEESEWFMAKIAERYLEKDFQAEIKRARSGGIEKKREVLDLVESRGEEGIDFIEIYYGGEVKRNEELGDALARLHVEGGFGCVIQDPPKHYLQDDETDRLLRRFYGNSLFYKIYSNSVIEKMKREGKIAEALGVAVPQLPHYVLAEQPAET